MAGVNVAVYVEDPTTALLTYTSVRVYRDTSPGGTFVTLVGTATLVAGTRDYTVNDATGDSNRFYRWSLYTATGPTETSLSPVVQPAGLTLLRLRVEAAQEAGLGFASTCSALGTTTTLIDAKLGDAGQDTLFGQGGYIYRPNAAATGDLMRRVSSFTVATGTWLIGRAWTNAPASAEVYHFFNACAPIDWPGEDFSWDRAVRNGLRDLFFRDFVNLGVGTSTGTYRYSLAEHAPYAQDPQIVAVYARTTDSSGNVTDTDYDSNGRYWEVQTESGVPTLILQPPPATDQSVMVELNRQYEDLYIDTDVTSGPYMLAVRATLVGLYEGLDLQRKGKFAAELQTAKALFTREYAKYRPDDVVRVG